MRFSLDDTLSSIRARVQTKVAEERPVRTDLFRASPRVGLHKLAEVLRNRTPARLEYAVLQKVASGEPPPLPLAPIDEPTGDGAELRKLAHTLRATERDEERALYADAVDTLAAAEALTLLRDL